MSPIKNHPQVRAHRALMRLGFFGGLALLAGAPATAYGQLIDQPSVILTGAALILIGAAGSIINVLILRAIEEERIDASSQQQYEVS